MKRAKMLLTVLALATALSAAGCGGKTSPQQTSAGQAEAAETTDSGETGSDQVATADEMADQLEVGTEGMEAVSGDSLKDGVYPIKVDSSSSMFKIVECELTVQDGKMSAVMSMSGKGYLRVYMGTGEEAANAPEEDCIPFVETAGGIHTFEVPVEALDKKLSCAAFSKNKEKWYERTLVFRADSLPPEAFADGALTTVESLKLADGSYMVEASVTGGSGKASVESPASMRVENGKAFVTLVWSSSNYDYMKVDGEQYDPINKDGNSIFEIPVGIFDRNVSVSADTTAMSEPHEIEYALYLDSTTIKKAE